MTKFKNQAAKDKHYMLQAFRLAEKGRGRTRPNPMVGAILVKDDSIIGKGYHKKAGTNHAEIIALNEAGENAKGATLYVTLEPCCHQGATPPCVDKIIQAKPARVVIAMPDPNPKVGGRGIRLLREAGIQVEVGLLENKARFQNEIFLKYVTTNIPFVILTIALTMDGKIATKTGDSKWVSGPESRQRVHQIRNQVDATCVGIGTIIRDDSRLTTRLIDKHGRDPLRVVIDSLLKVPIKANIFIQKSNASNIIVTTKNAFFKRMHEIEKTGSRVLEVNSHERNKVDLKDMIKELGKMGITSIMIEGGAEIAASAIKEDIVDKVIFFISPKIIGGKTAPCPIGGEGIAKMSDAIKLKHIKTKNYGEDIMIEGYIEKPPNCVYSPLGCGCGLDTVK